MKSNPLLDVSTHFRFGENWSDYSKLIDARRIADAENSLRALLAQPLKGLSFLDIGCGSGLFSLAATRLGANRVLSIDIDSASVETTRRVRAAHGEASRWDVEELSVFDATPETLGHFDVVYSWGALHHTGDMWGAIRKATSLVSDDGLLALAVYLRTPFCGFWRVEKRLYTNAPELLKRVIFYIYKGVASAYSTVKAKGAMLGAERGMDQDHDYKDWLGGYPYQSASPEEMDAFVTPFGFRKIRTNNTVPRSGLMGTGCAEYVYQRLRP